MTEGPEYVTYNKILLSEHKLIRAEKDASHGLLSVSAYGSIISEITAEVFDVLDKV